MSRELWVVNASPLITLAKIGQLQLLVRPGATLAVPEAVADEVRAGPEGDAASHAVEQGFGGPRVAVVPDPEVLEWGLGPGESAVLSYARQHHARAVVDDGEARAAARVFGVRVMGTLGVVVLARLEGRIESASGVLRALRDAGLYLDDALLRRVLFQTVGESWEA